VSGCLAAWEEWIGRRFDRAGEVVDVPGTLQPISVDLDNDRASYWDPAVWMEHQPLPADEDSWRPIDETALRTWLAEWLPAYMIPDSMLLRTRLPLTESGKVDRAALRRDPELLLRRRETALPRTDAQIGLAEIWRLVLGLDAVGIEDNFFRLGGNSMKAVRLVAEIRRAFGVELSLRDALQRPTIVGLERLLLSPGSAAPPAPAEVSPSPHQALPRSS
jgi:acyl carrier protein